MDFTNRTAYQDLVEKVLESEFFNTKVSLKKISKKIGFAEIEIIKLLKNSVKTEPFPVMI